MRMKATLRFSGLLTVLLCLTIAPQLNAQTVLPNHVPSFAKPSNDAGPVSANQLIKLKVWLQLHNSTALDDYINQVNDPNSPKYGQYLTYAQAQALYAPTANDAAATQNFLKSKGLVVTRVDPKNLYVEAVGSAATVRNAFSVQLNNYKLHGKTFRANANNPTISDSSVAPLIAAIGGFTNATVKPHNIKPYDPDGKAYPRAKVSPNGAFFEGNCFDGVETHTFTTGGSLPAATYKGNRFGAPITNDAPPNLPPCGYSPQELWTAYNLNKLYDKGLDGTGQTIVIVDAFGSTTIQQDVALFSAVYGLPAPDLTVIGTPVAPTNSNIAGWATETTLDVEWAHAIAPNAKIVLEVAASDSFDDINASLLDAISHAYGNVISNSYGAPESEYDPATLNAIEGLLKMAAVQGIAVNFSSGDDGDYVLALGYADVSYPASSKLATGVGGNSLFLTSSNKIKFQTGWGNNLTEIADVAPDNNPLVPPFFEGFVFGAGGGASRIFSKPKFQSKLSGSHRLVPDIGWVADPYTGVEFIQTDTTTGEPFVDVIGGTSVACPMFSGLWAVAAQKHGGPLGQAAPRLYKLGSSSITDVKAVSYGTNVYGVIVDSGGSIKETPRQLATPSSAITSFTSAFYNSPFSTRWFVLSFGTDSSLPTKTGWDKVTGLGTPNGYNFVTNVAK